MLLFVNLDVNCSLGALCATESQMRMTQVEDKERYAASGKLVRQHDMHYSTTRQQTNDVTQRVIVGRGHCCESVIIDAYLAGGQLSLIITAHGPVPSGQARARTEHLR